MTRREALRYATTQFTANGIADARREAELLLDYAFQRAPHDLAQQPDCALSAEEEKIFQAWLARRLRHEPLPRIAGAREFWGLNFALNEATLEPRADTETLVEAVLNAFPPRDAALNILDIGTGTGCILLALLHEYRYAQGIGSDYSVWALQAAQHNAAALGLDGRAKFVETNWADGVAGPFDIIVSNPPYICRSAIPTLQAEVRLFDPLLALDGGVDGLVAYRAIIPAAYALLKQDGLLALEIGFDQEAAVTTLLQTNDFISIAIRKDLNGIARVICGRKN